MPSSVLVGIGAALIFLIAGVALVWIGNSSRRGRLARNHLVGIRTSATLHSDAAWRAGHRAAGRRMIVGGLGIVVGALLAAAGGGLALFGASEDLANSVIAACILGSSAWAVAWLLFAARTANRAARATEDPGRS